MRRVLVAGGPDLDLSGELVAFVGFDREYAVEVGLAALLVSARHGRPF